ncbi:MAG: cell division protein FtsZ [Bacteroidales bacterium]|nr:cell division protein FtsZ [Bacteroidales bacterium]
MEDMIKFEMPKNQSSIIKVLGVGGGGSNAVNHMHRQGITGVDFIVCNTDAQALDMSPVPNKISLGEKGLGAGSVPLVAEKAAIEKSEDIKKLLASNTEMLFITAGMGGGTGTGAAPVIARLAKEIDLTDEEVSKILVVAIVTLPFSFEGRKRKQQAEKGIEELRKYADAVLIISNDKLRELYGNLGLSEAFKIADNVLLTAAKGIAELITVKAYVNIDFKDVNTVMKDSGVAIMGTGIAEGENRAGQAIEAALNSPLLNDNDIKGTNNILLYLSSGQKEISMDEITEITEYILDEAGCHAEVIWGAGRDDSLGNQISVTIVATGFDKEAKVDKEKIIKDLYGNRMSAKADIKEVVPPRPTRPLSEPRLIEEVEEQESEIRLVNTPNDTEEISKPTISTNTDEEKPKIIRFTLDDSSPEPAKEDTITEISAPIDEIVETETEDIIFEEKQPMFKTVKEREADPIARENKETLDKKAKERIERLRMMSIKLKSPGGLTDLEAEPAYRRKNVELSDAKPSEESKISKYTLSEGEDDNAELKSDNTFLHDNVD